MTGSVAIKQAEGDHERGSTALNMAGIFQAHHRDAGGPAGNTPQTPQVGPLRINMRSHLMESWLHWSWDDSGCGWEVEEADMDSLQHPRGSISRWCGWTSVNLGTWGAESEGTVCFCDVTGGQADGPSDVGWPCSFVSLLWEVVRSLHAQLALPDLSSASNAPAHIITEDRESSVHHV